MDEKEKEDIKQQEQKPKGWDVQVKIALKMVRELRFALLCDELPHGQFQIQNQLKFKPNTSKREVGCWVNIEYRKNDITQLMLTVETTFEFERESWSSLYNLDKDSWRLPVGLLRHMADMTFGAARGILAVRTADKGYNDIVLPIIPVEGMLKKDLSLPRTQSSEEQG